MTVRTLSRRDAEAKWLAWFADAGRKPLPFQREVWKRWLNGESGMLHTPTGSGKTLAAVGGVLHAASVSCRHRAD